MSMLADAFTTAYKSKFQERKLIFLGTLGSAELILDGKVSLKVATV